MSELPTPPAVWWSPSRGLLRQVGDELRGPRGLLDEPPADAVRLVPDTGQAREPVMTETVRAVVRRLSRTRREFAEFMPCTYCNDIGVVPEEAFGRDEDGAPMVDGVQPCPEGCELPGWLVAERNDARDDAAELDRLSAAADPDTGQAREQGIAERAAKLGAAVHQERADQLAAGLMALADDMRSMAGQWPDNAAARNAYGVAEMRARNLVAADRETENHFRPEPSGDTDPLRASGRRFCEGDCSCGHDHERHGPEVPGCIECSCRITPEAGQ